MNTSPGFASKRGRALSRKQSMVVVMRTMIGLALLSMASLASAQRPGTVTVRVVDSAGRPMDGTVTFRGRGTATCRTVAGRCQVQLAAGSWSATLQPVRERATGVMRVNVQPGRVANMTFRTQAVQQARPAVRGNVPVQTTAVRRTRTTAQPSTTVRPSTAATPRVTTTRRTTVSAQTGPRITSQNPSIQGASTNTTVARRRTTTTVQARPQARPQQAVVTTARPQQAVVTSTPSGRNLAQGRRLCVQGAMVDAAGRPSDGTVTVRQGASVIGTVRSVAGRFSMFDLAPGRYELSTRAARTGAITQQTLNLPAGVARVTIRLR